MVQKARRLLAFALIAACGLSGQSVILVSLDGLGHKALETDAAAAELHTLREAARKGVQADGVQPAFPSLTANSHAAIWTGAYGDVNGVTTNNPPLLPRAAHLFSERGNGFFGTFLRAETFWVKAGRRGVCAVAHQPTQGFPFARYNTAPEAACPPVVVNGYQTSQYAGYALFRRKDAVEAGKDLVVRHGPVELKLRPGRGRMEISGPAGGTVEARLGGGFSEGLYLDQPTPAVVYFRLLESGGSGFRLLATPVSELGYHDPRGMGARDRLLREAGGFAGNGASALLARGDLTPGEYLETVELSARQMARHAAWLFKRYRPRLFQTYLPFPDEFEHAWLGLARAGAPEVEQWRRQGYAIVERFAREIERLAGLRDNVVWTSDHGMAPVSKSLAVNKVLEEAGLGGKAAHLYNSVLIDTADWKGGTVRQEERAGVVEAARRALEAVRDPETGQRIVTAFFTPEEHGAEFGIGGEACGDLYFDLAPGYRAVDGSGGTVVQTLKRPMGVHGFLPSREDMLAIFIARGPGFAAGGKRPRMKSIEIAPLVLDLAGAR
jgi:hypothetical protein